MARSTKPEDTDNPGTPIRYEPPAASSNRNTKLILGGIAILVVVIVVRACTGA